MKWKDSQGQSKEIRIIEESSHKWRIMGNLLGIPTAKLTSYRTAHLNMNEACCEEVLLYWLGGRGSQEYSVTWDGFHKLLEDVDLVALAEKYSQALQANQNLSFVSNSSHNFFKIVTMVPIFVIIIIVAILFAKLM